MNDISIGDLVIVVKPSPCCNSTKDIGKIFTVLDITEKDGVGGECWFCGKLNDAIDAKEKDDYWHDIDTLEKIPPLAELDKNEIKEKITA